MNWSMIRTAISAVSTVVIAIYSWRNYCLTIELKKSNERRSSENEEFREQIKDLYQAITIATIISSTGTGVDQGIRDFKSHYTGKVKIFK